MATYKELYLAKMQELQSHLNNPLFKNPPKLKAPKKIGRKQLERISRQEYEARQLATSSDYLMEQGLIPKQQIELPSNITINILRSITKQYPYPEQLSELYTDDIVVDTETGEIRARQADDIEVTSNDTFPSATNNDNARNDYYNDNEYNDEIGEEAIPDELDNALNAIDAIISKLDSFTPDAIQLANPSPMFIGQKWDMIDSLKNDINYIVDIADNDEIIEIGKRIINNIEVLNDRIEAIMYRAYESNGTEYDAVIDYELVYRTIAGEG